jgi:hypothetical protein
VLFGKSAPTAITPGLEQVCDVMACLRHKKKF